MKIDKTLQRWFFGFGRAAFLEEVAVQGVEVRETAAEKGDCIPVVAALHSESVSSDCVGERPIIDTGAEPLFAR